MRADVDGADVRRPTLGWYGRCFVFYDRPGVASIGPTEALPAIKQAGYTGVVFQRFDGQGLIAWPDEPAIASRLGLDVGWWARCRTLDDVRNLRRQAAGKPTVYNLEDELWSGALHADEVAAEIRGQTLVGVSYPGDAPREAGLEVIERACDAAMLPQTFQLPDGRRLTVYDTVRWAVEHLGLRRVAPTLQAYPLNDGTLPRLGDYQLKPGRPLSVFTADAVTDWGRWT